MNKKTLLTNLYRYHDGEMDQSEQDEFKEYLTLHPEAGVLFNQWEKIKDWVEFKDDLILDPDLQAEIIRRINSKKKPNEKKKSWTYSLLGWYSSFFEDEWLRLGVTFVGGLVGALLILNVLKTGAGDNPIDSANLSGTLSDQTVSKRIKPAGTMSFATPEINGTCTVEYSTDIVRVHLDLSSVHEVNSTLGFGGYHFSELNIQQAGINEQSSTTVSGNKIRITNNGRNQYSFQFDHKKFKSEIVELEIVKSDSLLFQKSVHFN